MPSVPVNDPAKALVPHTLKEAITGSPGGPLAGRSFMIKDMFAVEGHKVSAGNPDYYAAASQAAATAPVITRLLAAGATLTGITICDEFFYSLLGTNTHYGTPINTRALSHVAGGSSCGAAAAVAAGMCDFALGADTGGSIRVPSAFSGLYGLRPTHGRIDMTAAVAMAPSYDTAGVLANDAELFRAANRTSSTMIASRSRSSTWLSRTICSRAPKRASTRSCGGCSTTCKRVAAATAP